MTWMNNAALHPSLKHQHSKDTHLLFLPGPQFVCLCSVWHQKHPTLPIILALIIYSSGKAKYYFVVNVQ